MRFTDNAAITTDNMATDDILAGTDVSASADKKFSLENLANWFLNKFTGLSLAGSQQTVKSALDSLNSNSKNMYTMTGTEITSGSNIDTFITPGKYYCATSATAQALSGCPVTVAFTMYVMRRQTGGVTQIIYASDTNFSVYRRSNNTTGSTTWMDTWKLEPTRAEMDALSEIYTGTTNFTSIDPIQPNNARGIGAWLDAKVHAQISTFSTGEVHLAAGVNDSVAYGRHFIKHPIPIMRELFGVITITQEIRHGTLSIPTAHIS